jgi:hypothetical protein
VTPIRVGRVIRSLEREAAEGNANAARELRAWLAEYPLQDEGLSMSDLDRRTKERLFGFGPPGTSWRAERLIAEGGGTEPWRRSAHHRLTTSSRSGLKAAVAVRPACYASRRSPALWVSRRATGHHGLAA